LKRTAINGIRENFLLPMARMIHSKEWHREQPPAANGSHDEEQVLAPVSNEVRETARKQKPTGNAHISANVYSEQWHQEPSSVTAADGFS